MTTPPDVPIGFAHYIKFAVDGGWFDLNWVKKTHDIARNTPDLSADIFLTDPRFFTLSSAQRFDTERYLALYPDVSAFEVHPLLHYLRYGVGENRFASPVFDAATFSTQLDGCKIWYESHELSMTGGPLWLMEVLSQDPQNSAKAAIASPFYGPLDQAMHKICKSALIHGQTIRAAQNLNDLDEMVDRLAKLMQTAGTECVVANSVLSFMAIAAAAKLGLPCMMIIHEPDPETIYASLPPALHAPLRAALKVADICMFVSENSHELWAENHVMKCAHVIEKALPLSNLGNANTGRALAGCTPDDALILSVGTLSERKGQVDLIAALEHLQQTDRTKNFVVVMFGYHSTPYAQDIRNRAVELKNKGLRIFILPQSENLSDRSRIMDMFAAADIFVMTSRSESLPRTTQEAQASGCAIISTDMDGIGNMVRDGIDGHLYHPGDHKTLATLMDALAHDPAHRTKIAKAARQQIDPNSFDKMCADFGKLLNVLRNQ